MTRYRPVDAKVDLPALEERVLDFWRERVVFRASIELRAGAPEWVFYDGPPRRTTSRTSDHVEARTFKDVYPGSRRCAGDSVVRKGGWDCHGLPVEVEVEKEIGTQSEARHRGVRRRPSSSSCAARPSSATSPTGSR